MTQDLQQYGITAKLPEVCDHSFTGTYLECERMAYYQNILGRAKPEMDFALAWGRLFHRLVQTWTETGDLQQIIDLIDLNLDEDVDDRYGRTKMRMQEAFIEWVKFRRADPIEILRTEQPAVVACLDGPCPYSATGCGLVYGGRLDEIIRWNAMVGPLDIKTTVMDTSDPATEYKPSHQMIGYTWMTTHLMGKACWGTIVERIIINKSKIKIHRFPIPYPKDQILEWVENERLVQAEIAQKFELHRYNEAMWKQNMGRCALPYRCKFRDVCNSPRDAGFRLRWLRDNTVERRFDFRNPDEVPPNGGTGE